MAKDNAKAAQSNASAEAKTDKVAQPSPNDGDKPEDAPLPASVKLAAPYGFIDDETGEHRYWQAGQEVTNPEEIKVLVERQAPLE